MPIYEFRCRSCGSVFEAIRPVGDDGGCLACPECGRRAPERILSTFATATGTSSSDGVAEACSGRSFG